MAEPSNTSNKVCVIGAGTMGAQLALLTAMAGRTTILIGRTEESLAKAQRELERRFAELNDAGLVGPREARWQSCLVLADGVDEAADAAVVIEAIIEDVDAKANLFARLDTIASLDTLLLSSTSGLPVDAIAAHARRPERIAVAHFANPPHLMPAVELVPGTATSESTMTRTENWISGLGKIPIRLKRDLPGHLFNRLQFAMLREAMALVRDGVAEADQVDAVVKYGLALRLAEEGPIEKMDLAGLELVARVAGQLFPDLDCSTAPDHLEHLLAQGRTGAAQGQGFYDWTSAQRDTVISRRNREVMRHLGRLRARGLLPGTADTAGAPDPDQTPAEET